MQPTTSTFNPYTTERTVNFRAIFKFTDTTASQYTTATASDSWEISNLIQTHNEIIMGTRKIATLERDYFKLDGTFILPERNEISTSEVGWYSDKISGADGRFNSNPILRYKWNEPHSSVGFTICFDDKGGQFASEFIIRAYNATNAVIASGQFVNNDIIYFANLPVEGYFAIEVEFVRTSEPYRRIRVVEVIFGAILNFDKNNITAASLIQEISRISETLATTEFNIIVDNHDARWNITNPNGVYAYLQESQPFDVYIEVNGESVFIGRYYFSKAEAEDLSLTARIVANDKIYLLEKSYRAGQSGTWTFAEAIASVITASNVNLTYYIPPVIASRNVGRNIPKDMTCRDSIAKLAQAARCTCYIDRSGVLQFFDPLAIKQAVEELDYDAMHGPPKALVGEGINTVLLSVKDEFAASPQEIVYTAADVGQFDIEKIKEVANPLVKDGNAVALWLLSMYKRRMNYNLVDRGNPARDISDIVTIADAYGNKNDALILRQQIDFDGGMRYTSVALGV